MTMNIEVVQGDITEEYTDAIVNAANPKLLHGGGVSHAIFKAAGSAKLEEECSNIGSCPTGEAVITRGFDLNADWIIHTVGPKWDQGSKYAEKLLASCYLNSLNLAKQYGIESIAFPSIATGIYGYPVEEAAKVAVRAIHDSDYEGRVRIVAYTGDNETFGSYAKELNVLRLIGKWINQNGSTLTIEDVSATLFEGVFNSTKGSVDSSQEFPVVGTINGDVIAFSVDFGHAASIANFTGKLTEEGELHTVWLLARNYVDTDQIKRASTWNSLMINSDQFKRISN